MIINEAYIPQALVEIVMEKLMKTNLSRMTYNPHGYSFQSAMISSIKWKWDKDIKDTKEYNVGINGNIILLAFDGIKWDTLKASHLFKFNEKYNSPCFPDRTEDFGLKNPKNLDNGDIHDDKYIVIIMILCDKIIYTERQIETNYSYEHWTYKAKVFKAPSFKSRLTELYNQGGGDGWQAFCKMGYNLFFKLESGDRGYKDPNIQPTHCEIHGTRLQPEGCSQCYAEEREYAEGSRRDDDNLDPDEFHEYHMNNL